MPSKVVMGVAKSMKRKFGDRLDLTIYSNNSKEALLYDLKASTTVFVNQERISLDVATSKNQMELYLKNLAA